MSLRLGLLAVSPALVVISMAVTEKAQDPDASRAEQREELQKRAEEIVKKNQQNEITTGEARRRVQLLLKDLVGWSKQYGVELDRRTRAFRSPAVGRGEILTADRCPLFFEEKLDHLCPLDFSRSEVWGASVVFCRYLCAPGKTGGKGAPPSSWTGPRSTSSS